MDAHRSPSWSDAVRPRLLCRSVATADELAQHLAIRRAVFVAEQSLFAADDRDLFDDRPTTNHVLGFVNGVAAGTVRFYPLAPDDPGGSPRQVVWKGDRLGVLRAHRHAGLGAPLVRHAVRSAAAAGGDAMVAWVQLPNVRFFRRLGWLPVGRPAPYVGVDHQQMRIGLPTSGRRPRDVTAISVPGA